MNLAMIYSELMDVGAPITAVLTSSEHSDGGLEVGNKYIIQLSKYESEPIILSIMEDGGIIDASSFKSIGDLIKFIMEN